MSKCARCCCETTGENRMVTDSCGHAKCRLCLVADVSDCLECRVANQESAAPAAQLDAKPRTAADKCILVTDQGYHCTVCNKDFRSRTQQYYHLACGNDQLKKFSCNECSRRFATRSHLQYHLSSHEKQTKHSCSVCNKRFKQQVVLNRHMRTHSTELHVCPQCPKEFRRESSLKSHLAAHSDLGLPYNCELCSKQFQSKANLKQHCRKHDKNSLRHKCKVCQKSFLRQSTLRLHIKRHSNRERLSCPLCGKSYNDADALARHQKQHITGGERYRCVQCEITVNRKDNMLRHLRSMHPGVAFENCVEIVTPNPNPQEPALVEQRPVESLRYNSVIKSVGNVEPVMLPQSPHPEVPLEKPAPNPVPMSLPVAMPEKNVQLYRKIILDLDNEEYSEMSLDEGDETATAQNAQDLGLQQSQPRCPGHGSSKFSEMHWRKNFKASYEKGRTN
ncbi:zinc finger protein 37 [Drosophila serrata]|uniref:zinc finger protein 37 n=1 Tax=Drosophila serrata TaxID=7274 RepID=UPI000A1D356B|nr:zinc finger protein 37 [Drosophila serrata]